MTSDCPDFAEATRRFAAFLREQGWPEAIRWVAEGAVERVSRTEVVVYLRADDDGAADAARLFEQGRAAQLGVKLSAVCTWGDVTCVTVSYPRDELQARAYPPGLSLWASVPRVAGTARWPAC